MTVAGVAAFFFFLWWKKYTKKTETVELIPWEPRGASSQASPDPIVDDPMDIVDGYAVDPMDIVSGDEADDELDGVVVSKLRTINLYYDKNK